MGTLFFEGGKFATLLGEVRMAAVFFYPFEQLLTWLHEIEAELL